MQTKQITYILTTVIIITTLVTSVLAIYCNTATSKITDIESILNTQSNQLDTYDQLFGYQANRIDELKAIITSQNDTLNEYNQTIGNAQQQYIQELSNLSLQLNNELFELTEQTTDLNERFPVQQYDYIIYRHKYTDTEGYTTVAKNGKTGEVEYKSTNTSSVFNYALEIGKRIYVQTGYYSLESDIICYNKQHALIEGEGTTINCNNHKIIINGYSYTYSQNNVICGFIIVNGTVRIENSCKTTITNMNFENCLVGIELANTYLWSECNKIDDVHFIDCTQGIVFRTPTGSSTGSYSSCTVSRCYFNLRDDSIAIDIEPEAQFHESKMQNVRIWIAGYAGQQNNQTGLQISGTIAQSIMDTVVFESFATGNLDDAEVYAVRIDSPYSAGILQPGVTFLGSWTEKIYNPQNTEVQGEGSCVAFKQENISIPVNPLDYPNEPTSINVAPATISAFKALIIVSGNFDQNETITVRFRLGFFDKAVAAGSEIVEKTFTSSSSLWLSDYDLLKLLPSKDVVESVLVDAKVDSPSTDVTVQISIFGTTVWSAM